MRRILVAAAVVMAGGCDSTIDPIPIVGDVTAPVLSLVHVGDRTGDGLVDFEVTWADPGGSVRGTRVSARSLRALRPARSESNLLSFWPTTVDSNRVRFSENIYAVLPAGENQLEVSVVDAAGNVGVDTFTFTLPQLDLHRRISLGRQSLAHLLVCDDPHVVISAGGRMILVNPDDGYVREIPNAWSSQETRGVCAYNEEAAVYLLPESERLIAAVYDRGLVVMERDGRLVAEAAGVTNDLLLSNDRTRLFAGMREGLVQLEPATLAIQRTLALDGAPRRITVRRDEARAFVTTDSETGESHNYLVDLTNWRVLATLPRPATGLRIDSGAMFEPGGTRLYTSYHTPQGAWLEIYIDRS